MSDEKRLACQRLVTSDGVLESAVLTIVDSYVTAITTAEDDPTAERVTGCRPKPFGGARVTAGQPVSGTSRRRRRSSARWGCRW